MHKNYPLDTPRARTLPQRVAILLLSACSSFSAQAVGESTALSGSNDELADWPDTSAGVESTALSDSNDELADWPDTSAGVESTALSGSNDELVWDPDKLASSTDTSLTDHGVIRVGATRGVMTVDNNAAQSARVGETRDGSTVGTIYVRPIPRGFPLIVTYAHGLQGGPAIQHAGPSTVPCSSERIENPDGNREEDPKASTELLK